MAFIKRSSNQNIFPRREEQNSHSYHSISSKMERLYERRSLTFHDCEIRNQLRKYIKKILRKYYPDCEVYICGSSNNGFGSTGCDIDLLFLPYPEYLPLVSEKDDNDEQPPTLEQVENGEVHKYDLLKMRKKFQLLFVMQVFQTLPKQFSKVVFVSARCPIIKFEVIWKGSRFLCDLSCQNRLVLYNTELLKAYGMIDSRVRPLVFTLCQWAKCLKRIMTLNFSTYAFTLMVIFFLQSVDPPVLPSVNYLMNVAGSSKVVAGFKVGYAYDLSKVPKSENKNTNEELLKQFFDYYWNFDFNKHIVCVRTGSALPIRCIEETFQDGCTNFEITAVCVEDPFDLHNVTSNMKQNRLRDVELCFLIASKTLNKYILTPFDMYMFDRLFYEDNYREVISDFYSVPSKNTKSIMIDMNYEITSALDNVENAKTSWYYDSSEAVLQILSKGLLFDCEVIDRMRSPLQKETLHPKDELFATSKANQSVNFTLKDMDSILSIQCAVSGYSWKNRKNVTAEFLQLDPGFSVIEKEECISKHILEADPPSDSTPFFSFICHCYKSKFPQIPCLIVELTPLTKSNEFKNMAERLSTFIPQTLKEYFSA